MLQKDPAPSSTSAARRWRSQPGYLSAGGSEFESIHILLGRFLADRHSPNPLAERSLLAENPSFEWGRAQPLEKVIDSPAALEALMLQPQLFRNAIAIIEPWEHVGHNPQGEPVRASVNVAYIAQKLADCDTILLPLWASGLLNLHQLIPVISSGLAIVVEGGNSSVRDPASFDEANCSHEDLLQLTEQILLARSPTSAPALFICLGHQLAAQAHIRLIRQAVDAALSLQSLPGDNGHQALRAIQRVCRQIRAVGQSLVIQKRDGRKIASGWTEAEFAVAENESKEVGDRISSQIYQEVVRYLKQTNQPGAAEDKQIPAFVYSQQ